MQSQLQSQNHPQHKKNYTTPNTDDPDVDTPDAAADDDYNPYYLYNHKNNKKNITYDTDAPGDGAMMMMLPPTLLS